MTKLKRKQQIEDDYLELAEDIARRYWGVEMTCPIVWVDREWKRMNASFRYSYNPEDDFCEIRLNHRVRERLGDSEYMAILKHELAHWYLRSTGQPNDDDDPEFIRECIRIGAPISGTKKAQRAYEQVLDLERLQEEAEVIGG